ncbi:hypothetical protein HYU13_04345 [Candidatus Woesearchaeota archaeon]|nr:hypothetical protein [Candidatus Woesearchaeota archaeon]
MLTQSNEKHGISDDSILVNAKTLVAILQVTPVNVSELDSAERENLSFQYRYFLRSLAFPIQISLRFANIDALKAAKKRLAKAEEAIRKSAKSQKEALQELDAFREWLKVFIECKLRPMLFCYIAIAVTSETDLKKSHIAYVTALQLLNQRVVHCINRLSSIVLKKKHPITPTESSWESSLSQGISKKKAMLFLKVYNDGRKWKSLDTGKTVRNCKRKLAEASKKGFIGGTEETEDIQQLRVWRLSDSQLKELLGSWSDDFISANISGSIRNLLLKDQLMLWKKGELKGVN